MSHLRYGQTKSCGQCHYVSDMERMGKKNISYQGETHSVTTWAKLYGIEYGTLYQRLRIGWSFEKAINTPVGPCRRKKESEET